MVVLSVLKRGMADKTHAVTEYKTLLQVETGHCTNTNVALPLVLCPTFCGGSAALYIYFLQQRESSFLLRAMGAFERNPISSLR